MSRPRLRTLAATGAAVTAAAGLGGLATDPDSAWYRTLKMPPWQPPPATFGLVWTPLYATIAGAGAKALDTLADDGKHDERRAYATALGVNLALNAGWSWLFFRAHRPWLAAGGAAVLAASSADLARRTARVDRRAGWAMSAYPLWCTFATVLSADIARRNS